MKKRDHPPQKSERNFKSRLYYSSIKFHDRFISPTRGPLWTAFWLGILNHADFDAIDATFYDDLSMYRSDEHNMVGLFDWEEKNIKEYFPDKGSLLVTSVGGGREVFALERLGYDVAGFECNVALVEFANEFLARQGCHSRVEWVARNCAPEGTELYDGAIIGWGAYMHIPQRRLRLAFLKAIRGQMKENAPLFLSFFTRTSVSKHYTVITKIGTVIRRLRLKPKLELGDDLFLNYVHRFTREEMESELAEAGFNLVHFQPQGQGKRNTGHAVGFRK